MNRKHIVTYGLAGGLLIAAAGMGYVYQEYLGEDTDPGRENETNPIINKRLNAIVVRIATTQADNQPKLDVAYTDLDTQETASFRVDTLYGQAIHVGDTVTKDKGEKMLLIYQKQGKIETVPID